ncbi:MAG: Asp-tRNA(Asn)/Glu-tRNA(Gln) amidotransferase subunit GatC [Candidatus Liptonbacteria bacterium]|nr:Asp-tRNA(Asn)/Glu-tRNA(Gln) amidotransferase subunit GatC [Candidatus Liptonbacteria bacterium]
MPSPINKKVIKHLAELARLELTPREEDRLMKDLQEILAHFEELQKLDTNEVKPMTGGTQLKNAFREDKDRKNKYAGAGVEAFPDNEKGFLKIPPVFDS